MPIENEKYIAPDFENNGGQQLDAQIFQDIADSIERIDSIELDKKVDKIDGKQLSTHDYTTEEKEKVATCFPFLGLLTNTQDLNDLKKTGRWIQSGNAYASLERNYPVALAGELFVFGDVSTTFAYQWYHSYGENNCLYIRTWYNTTGWSAWKGLANTSQLPQIVQTTGTSTSQVMSQKAVTDAIGATVDIVQETGNSETSVMSQNAVTASLNEKMSTEDYCTQEFSGETIEIGAQAADMWANVTRIGGNTEQKASAQGKNLLDFNHLTYNGLQFVEGIIDRKNRKIIVINKNAEAGWRYYRLNMSTNLTAGKKYTLSFAVEKTYEGDRGLGLVEFLDENGTRISIYTDIAGKISFEVPEEYASCILQFTMDTANNNAIPLDATLTIFDIQIEEGDTATAYEPFIPNRPSPEYPSEINGVGDNGVIEIKARGRNLFDMEQIAKVVNAVQPGLVTEVKFEGYECWKCEGKHLPDNLIDFGFKPNTQYTFRTVAKGTNPEAGKGSQNTYVKYADGTTAAITNSAVDGFNDIIWTSAEEKTIVGILYSFSYDYPTYYQKDSLVCVEGTEISADIKPYKGKTVSLAIDAPLRTLQDADGNITAQDYIDVEAGEIVRNIGAVEVPDASSGATMVYDNHFLLQMGGVLKGRKYGMNPALCTHFVYDQNNMHHIGSFRINPNPEANNEYVYFTVACETVGLGYGLTKEEYTAAFNVWKAAQKAAGTPVVVQYTLAEPTRTPFTKEQNEVMFSFPIYKNEPTFVESTDLIHPCIYVDALPHKSVYNSEMLGGKPPEYYLENGSGSAGDAEPIGVIKPYAGETLPDGYLWCDGTSYPANGDYLKLYEIIGTAYNQTGDAAGKFRVPDLRGRVVVGKNEGTFNALGKTGGEEAHTLTGTELPRTNIVSSSGFKASPDAGSEAGSLHLSYSGSANGGGTTSWVVNGGGEAHNNLQPYAVCNYIIKYARSYGEIGVTAPPCIWDIAAADWILGEDGIYTLSIPESEHRRGEHCVLTALYDTSEAGKLRGVLFEMEKDVSGNITIYSDAPFAGKAYIDRVYMHPAGRVSSVNGQGPDVDGNVNTVAVAKFKLSKDVTPPKAKMSVVPFDTVIYSTANGISVSNGIFTLPQNYKYIDVIAGAGFTSATSGGRMLLRLWNGTLSNASGEIVLVSGSLANSARWKQICYSGMVSDFLQGLSLVFDYDGGTEENLVIGATQITTYITFKFYNA